LQLKINNNHHTQNTPRPHPAVLLSSTRSPPDLRSILPVRLSTRFFPKIIIYLFIYYIYIYIFLTAIGLTPGGSSTVHIYTQIIHRIQRTEHT
jgi:hypothetical protein